MDIFIATQPIFDRKLKVNAYEILYRESKQINEYQFTSRPDTATSRVLSSLFESNNRARFTGEKKVHINFTEELLLNEVAFFYPAGEFVIEIGSDVAPTAYILDKCAELKAKGYVMALDEFNDDPDVQSFLQYANILNIDVHNMSNSRMEKIVRKYKGEKILLAQKIETNAEFSRVFGLGVDLFQGYFFSKPQIISSKEIAPIKANYFRLLKMCNYKFMNFTEVGGIISNDVALTLKLLRLVNSVSFPHRNKIKSVRMALSYIGEEMVRRWVSLIVMTDLCADKPSEVIRLSLIRAKFGEFISPHMSPPLDATDMFILGMFSLLNIAVDADFDIILRDIAISEAVKEMLIKGTGPYAGILEFYSDYEHAEWDKIEAFARKHNIDERLLGQGYMDAMVWYNEFLYDISTS